MSFYSITFSPTGGTQKVADCLTTALTERAVPVDLCEAGLDFSVYRLHSEDVCVVAVPVYAGRVPALCAQRLALLEGGGARAILVAVYGGRAFEDALLELRDVATRAGFSCVAGLAAVAQHSIAPTIAAQRPDATDRVALDIIAEQLRDRLESGERPAALPLPGNMPYREAGAPPVPAADESCIRCGLCADGCPARAIPEDDPTETDPAQCIGCMRCVSVCPVGARALDVALVTGLTAKLQKVCPARPEPELFL